MAKDQTDKYLKEFIRIAKILFKSTKKPVNNMSRKYYRTQTTHTKSDEFTTAFSSYKEFRSYCINHLIKIGSGLVKREVPLEELKAFVKKEFLEQLEIYGINKNDKTIFSKGYFHTHSNVTNIQLVDAYSSYKELLEECLPPEYTFTRKNIDIHKDVVKKKGIKRFFITSVMPDSELHQGFFKSIKTYLKHNKAELIVLPMRGIHHTHQMYQEEVINLSDHFATEYDLSGGLKALDAQIPPSAQNPLNGMSRLAYEKSIIIAHPKQQEISLPTNDKTNPRTMMSTGVLTYRKYAKTRTGFLGEQDSILGGIIVEIDYDKDIFFSRFIQAEHDTGIFYDLDKKYTPTRVSHSNKGHLYIGDVHCGFTDEVAKKATIEMANTLKIKEIYGGDWFDGYSISHHHDKNITVKVNKIHKENLATIEREIENLALELKDWRKKLNKDIVINIIRSNHDEHLDRYLNEQRFFNDHVNYKISLYLAKCLLDSKNPLQEYINLHYSKLNITSIKWLKRSDNIKVTSKKILLSLHGDIGINGARNSNIGSEIAYHNCVLGHSHSPSVLRSVYRVGTLALDLEYAENKPSSWQVKNCLIHENGQRQLLWVSPKGQWRI